MTVDQIIPEIAAEDTQIKAFTTFMGLVQTMLNDAFVGDSLAPSVRTKYDAVFSKVDGKAAEILWAIETGKPALVAPQVKPAPAMDPNGPMSPEPVASRVKPVSPTGEPLVTPTPLPSPPAQTATATATNVPDPAFFPVPAGETTVVDPSPIVSPGSPAPVIPPQPDTTSKAKVAAL